MRYHVLLWGGLVTVEQEFESDSRDSKKFLRDTGADNCEIRNKQNCIVSAAKRDADGSIYNLYISDTTDPYWQQ